MAIWKVSMSRVTSPRASLIGFPASTHSALASSSNRACVAQQRFQRCVVYSAMLASVQTSASSAADTDHTTGWETTDRYSVEAHQGATLNCVTQCSRISRRCQLASAAIGACASTAAAMALQPVVDATIGLLCSYSTMRLQVRYSKKLPSPQAMAYNKLHGGTLHESSLYSIAKPVVGRGYRQQDHW